MAVSNEVLLRQARAELTRAKGKHRDRWAAEVARLETLLNPPPTPEVVPEPTHVVAVAEPLPPVMAVKPTSPSPVRVNGRLSNSSSRRHITFTFGARVPGQVIKELDALHARAVLPGGRRVGHSSV